MEGFKPTIRYDLIGVLYGRVGSLEEWKGRFGFSRHGTCGSGDELKPVLVFGGRRKIGGREIVG